MTEALDYMRSLLLELTRLPRETEWVEFKLNNADPKEIGEYISALSNSAALSDKAHGYLVWGVENLDHTVVGTDFRPSQAKYGNENLENWLIRLLDPAIAIRITEFEFDGKLIAMIEVPRASHGPIKFQGYEHIRVGSYKKNLKDHPEKERELWRVFDHTPFEDLVAGDRLSDTDVTSLLDYASYFDLLKQPLPEGREQILTALQSDQLIAKRQDGSWDILNLGAVLFAKKLESFRSVQRKGVRVIQYKDNSRTQTIREYDGQKGYAVGYSGLIGFVNSMLPQNEVIGEALRKIVPMYPELAVRELVANAIIHQDYSMTGTSPLIEIFADRLEVTNPGVPLMGTDRFVDTPPRSRNESLASLMRRVGICEERGSGIDKVVFETEFYQLPAPLFEVSGGHTRAVLFAHRPFSKMDKEDRMRACYLHACLQYVNRAHMNNTSLRKRFGIEEKNSAQVSRIIGDTVNAGLIRLYDQDSGSKKLARYIPSWA